jgi:hypothetical protein
VQVSPKGMLPPPRHSHMLHMHNDWLYLFGGVNELGASTVSLFKAHISRTAVDRAGALHAAAAGGGGLGPGSYHSYDRCICAAMPLYLVGWHRHSHMLHLVFATVTCTVCCWL